MVPGRVLGFHAECLSTANAVWAAHPGSHATWRLRLPGHEGTKCWFASSRERKGSDADASTDAAHKIRAVSAMAIPPPRPRSQDTLAETERAPLPLRRSPLRLMKEDRFSFGAPRCGSTPPGRNCSLGGSVAPSDRWPNTAGKLLARRLTQSPTAGSQGSDPMHQGSRTCPRSDQPLGGTCRFYAESPELRARRVHRISRRPQRNRTCARANDD